MTAVAAVGGDGSGGSDDNNKCDECDPHPSTQVYIFCCQKLCSQRDTKKELLSGEKLKNLAEVMTGYSKIPRMRIYHNKCQKPSRESLVVLSSA